jgi:hypothetical protein
MVKVTKTTSDQRWGKHEHHFHTSTSNGVPREDWKIMTMTEP